MLYIFLVNNGTMMTFDVKHGIDTVNNLKSAIYEKCKIPVSDQVLLISGGESLISEDRLCYHNSAGTDTSPVFLFCKNDLPVEFGSYDLDNNDDDIKDRVGSCLQMEPNFNTVESRSEMATQIYETDRILYVKCEKYIHEQHLQQQSWAAVVANFEDCVLSFTKKAEKLEFLYLNILKNKPSYYELFEKFEFNKEILSKIPILKCLVRKSEIDSEITLLNWILKKDSKNSIDELYCLTELEEYTSENLERIKEGVQNMLQECDNCEMKEIRGLEQRLAALDKIKFEIKKTIEFQEFYKENINQNKTRIKDLRDPSILPDLCENHHEQLQSMSNNHEFIVENKNKFLYAKRELSTNLNQRLKWVIHIQEKLRNADHNLVTLGIKLHKLRKKLDVVQSLQTCPKIYFNTIIEVLRRRKFTDMFYNWAENISTVAKQLVDKEIDLRNKFNEQFDNHFLRYFFPGMNDLPQNFMLDPVRIDQLLPSISLDDVEYLKNTLPEMSDLLVVPSIVPINLNLNESSLPISDNSSQSTSDINYLLEQIKHLQNVQLEKEKILSEKNQTINDLLAKLNTINENKKSNINLINRQRTILNNSMDQIGILKSKTIEINNDKNNYQKDIYDNLNELGEKFNLIENSINLFKEHSSLNQNRIVDLQNTNSELENQVQNNNSKIMILNQNLLKEESKSEDYQKQIRNKENKLNSFKQELNSKQLILNELNNSVKNLNSDFINFQNEWNLLLNQLKDVELISFKNSIDLYTQQLKKNYENKMEYFEKQCEANKEQELQKLQDKFMLDYKKEFDRLQNRFKLAISTTSIERTASETSLEKVQLDIIDQTVQEKEIQKLKSMLNEQKNEYEQKISSLQKELDVQKSNENLRKINDDSISSDFFPQKILYDDILARFKEKISDWQKQKTESDFTNSDETLNTLSQDLTEFYRKLDLVIYRSFISLPTTQDAPNLSDINKINLEDYLINTQSCEIGDIVLVYYEKKIGNFVVFSLLDDLHYVHPDSLKKFSPSETDWMISKVTEKECCQIKKDKNRYNLPLNTKFYRIKVQKLINCQPKPELLNNVVDNNNPLMTSVTTNTLLPSCFKYFLNSSTSSDNI